MKARLFIGSSSEGYEVAEYIHGCLGADFECYLWKDDLFKFNDSAFHTLLREASLFDFGILVATKDDFTSMRNTLFETPRDNVVFEFGLFLGRLGASKVFFVQEQGSKIPSDLLGITVPVFEGTADLSQSATLNKSIASIRKTIEEKILLGELGLLPSTALAIGYFHNLVSIVCEHLYSSTEIRVGESVFRKFEMKVVMPSSLNSDVKKKAVLYYRKKGLNEIKLETSRRSFPVYVTYDEKQNDTLSIYDMPTTLLGIDEAIKMYIQKGHIGKSAEQKLLEERELRNFRMVLQSLIENDSYCSDLVRIIDE